MKLTKANFAGLTPPGQQSEMKAILASTWPPLKPLPVFKYETAEYRATIDFDKKRGEWVCRKTSLPSNEVQELRGGLREITMALPHGQEEKFIEGAEPQEPEFERETNRRLQAIREWKEKYQNGARYFELREFLSERQRTELDDSLRLALTARQLQFNAKNAADVFDDLAVAGGRFAALIELAKRKKANPETDSQSQAEAAAANASAPDAESAVPEAEGATEHDKAPLEISSSESGPALGGGETNNHAALVLNQRAEEVSAGADEFPALSIKNVFPEQEQTSIAERVPHVAAQPVEAESAEVVDADSPSDAEDGFPAVTVKDVSPEQELTPFAERMAHTAFQQFEMESAEIVNEDSESLAEPPCEEERRVPAITGIGGQARASRSFFNRIDGVGRTEGLFSADRIEDSYSRFPALRISAFQVNVFAILFLFAVTSFTVGLTVGRGPLGKRLRDAPKSLLAADAKPPALAEQAPVLSGEADESSSRIPPSPAASPNDSADTNKPDDATPSEEKFEAGTPSAAVPGSESTEGGDSAEVRFRDSDSSPEIGPKLSADPKRSGKTEVNPEPRGTIVPVERSLLPPARSKLSHPSKASHSLRRSPASYAPYRLTSTIAPAPQLPRASTILVTVPSPGSQPFRVSFPEKTVGATSSLAMTSQLSVLVSPEPGPTFAQKARLEAGELVFFSWPGYPTPGRYGLAETIRVRATISQLGQVEDVKFLSGSAALVPATMEAIRQWRYAPTLLDKRPVQAQQDITIEFRPPLYSSQLRTQHPPHN
ncbi:MAG TPA: energy transducer TonB [Candidatus Acidoferrum sp.]|nr:energy transducer TonB [Candidatus Acidoferrum sp.]